MNRDQIQKIVDSVDTRDSKSALRAARRIIRESAAPIKSGGKVAVIDDPTYAYPGCVGTVVGKSAQAGFTDVRFANGSTVPLQNDLLIPV